jgi:hypothetical protein
LVAAILVAEPRVESCGAEELDFNAETVVAGDLRDEETT